MSKLDNSSTYYVKPKHRTYLAMAKENYNFVRHAISHNYATNYTVVQAALSAVFYFKHIIDTFDINEESVEKRTEVLRSNNLATLLHYISNEMEIPISISLLSKATSLTSYYFALDEITTDTFVVTKEEAHFCFKNLEMCRKHALLIIDELEKSTRDNSDKIPDDVIVFEDKEYTL